MLSIFCCFRNRPVQKEQVQKDTSTHLKSCSLNTNNKKRWRWW